jgi:hypothetical protein
MAVSSIPTTYFLTVPVTYQTTSNNQHKFDESLTTHSNPLALL